MKIQGIWTNNTHNQIIYESYDNVASFIELLNFMKENHLNVYIDEQEVYSCQDFYEWMYVKDNPIFSDMKKELMIAIKKSQNCDPCKKQELLGRIGKNEEEKFFGMDFDEEELYYAATVDKFYDVCRVFLGAEDKKSFKEDMIFCFPNIFFDFSVQSSLNTLNRNFEDIRGEIVEHLTAINNCKNDFLQFEKQRKSYREIASYFEGVYGIECSPQASRTQTTELKRTFTNSISGKRETIVCELHTKFNKHNIDRTKQDRVYFAPAKVGLCDNNSIVIHIGKHL